LARDTHALAVGIHQLLEGSGLLDLKVHLFAVLESEMSVVEARKISKSEIGGYSSYNSSERSVTSDTGRIHTEEATRRLMCSTAGASAMMNRLEQGKAKWSVVCAFKSSDFLLFRKKRFPRI
jgi:hypothetical protein